LKGATCPYCTNKKVLPGFNDLATIRPDLAAEYSTDNELAATEITAGSLRKVNWFGLCGHKWAATPVNRKLGTGCPYCANQKLLVGFNDFATVHPHLLPEWGPGNAKSPTELTGGSTTRVQWVCPQGHTWDTTIKNRTTRGGTGCPLCVNVRESQIEGHLHRTLVGLLGEAEHQYDTELKWPSGHKVVVDVYIPKTHTVVEWDGSKWHSTRSAKDDQKSWILLDAGFRVLRLREYPLPMLSISHRDYAEINVSHRIVEPYFTSKLREGLQLLHTNTE